MTHCTGNLYAPTSERFFHGTNAFGLTRSDCIYWCKTWCHSDEFFNSSCLKLHQMPGKQGRFSKNFGEEHASDPASMSSCLQHSPFPATVRFLSFTGWQVCSWFRVLTHYVSAMRGVPGSIPGRIVTIL